MTSTWDSGSAGPPGFRRIRGDAAPRLPQRVRAVHAERPAEPPTEGTILFRLGRLSVDADGVFALALFLPLLFMQNLGTPGAAMVAALVPLYVFVRRERLLRTLAPRSFLFVIPALALFSVVWSVAARESLRFAVEFAITVTAGLLLSSARNQEAVLRGLAVAFFVYVLDSVLNGGYVSIGVGLGGQAFSGLTDSKNLLADIASTGLVVTSVMLLMALRGRSWLWAGLGVVAIVLDVYCVIAARSAGALLGLAMAIAAFGGLTPLVYAGRVLRAWITSAVALCLIAIGFNYQSLAQALIDLGATVFDKDATLTGRTYLWYRAADLIREAPLLGRGYQAFWLQGNTDAEGLWRYFGIEDRGGFTFHNTYVEILVTLGWIGLAVIGVTVLLGVVALVRRFVDRPNLPLVFWISVLLYELARTPIETIGISPFYFSTALMFAALGAAFGRVRTPRIARVQSATGRRMQEAEVVYVEAWANARNVPARGSLRIVRPHPEGES